MEPKPTETRGEPGERHPSFRTGRIAAAPAPLALVEYVYHLRGE
jgi:hypothetical protein